MNMSLGLDLGAAADYTAAVLVEMVHVIVPPSKEGFGGEPGQPEADGAHWRDDKLVVDTWHVRAITRWPLNTDYTQIVEDVVEMMADPLITMTTELIVDYAGPGRPVFDMFNDAFLNDRLGPWWPQPCTLSGGFRTATSTGTSLHKGDAIVKLLRAAQRERLTVPDMPLADALRHELETFSIKQSKSGSIRMEGRRNRDHDDILMAAAIAVARPHVHTDCRYVASDGRLRE